MNVGGWLARDASVAVRMLGGGDPDIMVFTETWLLPGQPAPGIAGYTAFTFSRPTQHQRRVQGGIAVYVRDALAGRVSEWHICPQACFAILRVSGILPSGRDLMLVTCYIPPSGSPHYDRAVWQRLEEQIGEAYASGEPLLVGDLNARTGDRPDFPLDVDSAGDAGEPMHFGNLLPVSSVRRSQDARGTVNSSGRRLLELCIRLGMRIANGRVRGDEAGSLTFVGRGGGSSLIDYVLASPSLMPLIQQLRVAPAPETDHLAVHLLVTVSSLVVPPRAPRPAPPPRMMGDDRLLRWRDLVSSQDCSDHLAELQATALTVSDQQALLTVCGRFDAFIGETWAASGDSTRSTQQAARQPCHRHRDQSARWFTAELARLRIDASRAMRVGARSEEALRLRRAYQRTLRRTRRAYIRRRSVALALQFRAEPRKFWSCFSSRGGQAPPIEVEHMTAHFRQLFEQPSDTAAAESADEVSAALSHRVAADSAVLDRPFTAAEVTAGILCLQRCKEGRKIT